MIFVVYFCILIVVLVAAQSASALSQAAVVLMLIISLFHPIMVSYPFGYVSNFGNVWFAGVLAIITFLTMSHGPRRSLVTVVLCLTWVSLMWIILLMMVATVPLMGGASADMYKAVKVIVSLSSRGAAMSVLGFCAASIAVIATVTMLRRHDRVVQFLCGCLAGQVVDSLIFFPITFWSTGRWIQIMMVGMTFKIVMSCPFTMLLVRKTNAY